MSAETERGRGAFLWSDLRPENDLPFWQRVVGLPFYLAFLTYHCLRGTPVYLQYGDHELRHDDTDGGSDE